jgi:hypothetical protein
MKTYGGVMMTMMMMMMMLIIIMALQPFVGPLSIFQFLDPIHSQ